MTASAAATVYAPAVAPIPDASTPMPDAGLEAADAKREIASLLEAADLTQRERYVLERRARDEVSLEVLAGELGRTRERVRQIERIALRKLREVAGSASYAHGGLSAALRRPQPRDGAMRRARRRGDA